MSCPVLAPSLCPHLPDVGPEWCGGVLRPQLPHRLTAAEGSHAVCALYGRTCPSPRKERRGPGWCAPRTRDGFTLRSPFSTHSRASARSCRKTQFGIYSCNHRTPEQGPALWIPLAQPPGTAKYGGCAHLFQALWEQKAGRRMRGSPAERGTIIGMRGAFKCSRAPRAASSAHRELADTGLQKHTGACLGPQQLGLSTASRQRSD